MYLHYNIDKKTMSCAASPEKADECLQVKCDIKTAEFFPLKYKKVGQNLKTSLGYRGKSGDKSIKFEGKPLAEWQARSEKSSG